MTIAAVAGDTRLTRGLCKRRTQMQLQVPVWDGIFSVLARRVPVTCALALATTARCMGLYMQSLLIVPDRA